MAYIKKMTDKPRTLPWRAQVRRKGHSPLVKMFKTRAEAEAWAGEQERQIRIAGMPLTIDELKNHTVGDIVRRYLKEITPAKGSKKSETAALNAFLRHDIAKKALAYVKKKDAWSYITERLKDKYRGKQIEPSTVDRERHSIQHVFEIAKERWGFENLVNPFRGIVIKGSMRRRTRILEDGEFERLLKACDECRDLNRFYIPLAIYLAGETGMRTQEIFNLTWADVDTEKRRAVIRKSKTDHVNPTPGRTIVLTLSAAVELDDLQEELYKHGAWKPSNSIFPISKTAFQQSFYDVRKRAGVTDFRFHDMRRVAGTFFHKAHLSEPESNLMLGHKNKSMSAVYIVPSLEDIQDKLDRYVLGGKTRDEAVAEMKAAGITSEGAKLGNEAYKNALRQGLSHAEARAAFEAAISAWRANQSPPNNIIPFPNGN